MVDRRVGGNLGGLGEITMAELAADYVCVLRELGEGRGRDLKVVHYAGVVISVKR